MPKYVFAYRIQEGDAGSPDAMAKWMAWFEELGAAVVRLAGNPVFTRMQPSGTLTAAGVTLGAISAHQRRSTSRPRSP